MKSYLLRIGHVVLILAWLGLAASLLLLTGFTAAPAARAPLDILAGPALALLLLASGLKKAAVNRLVFRVISGVAFLSLVCQDYVLGAHGWAFVGETIGLVALAGYSLSVFERYGYLPLWEDPRTEREKQT